MKHWSVILLVKVSHNLPSCNPPIARKHFWFIFYHFVFGGWAAYQTVFSVACNSDSEISFGSTPNSRNYSSYLKTLS